MSSKNQISTTCDMDISESYRDQHPKLTGFRNLAMDMPNDIKGDNIDTSKDRTKSPPTSPPKLPINSAGVISYIFASWLTPLMIHMYKTRNCTNLPDLDMWQCSEEEGVRVNAERLKALWKDEVSKRGLEHASFYRVWVKFIWRRTLIGLVILTLFCIATILSSGYLIFLILEYLSSDEDDVVYGIGLVAATLVCEVFRVTLNSCSHIFGYQTGSRFRSGVNGLMYDKLLKLQSLQGKHSEIINSFSVDSERVSLACHDITFILSSVPYLVICMAYSYMLIGYWFVLAIGTYFVCYLIQISLNSFVKRIRRRCIQFTQTRVRYIRELLHNMKFIKMYAWEQPFTDAIKGERVHEQRLLLFSGMLGTVSRSVISLIPTIAAVVTFAVYAAAGYQLTVPMVYALIGTFDTLRIGLSLTTVYFAGYVEALVSFKRIKSILALEDFVLPANTCYARDNAIEIVDGRFDWDPEDDATTTDKTGRILSGVSLTIKQGELLGICGAVGSGKSSLVSAILGRMPIQSGHLAVNGELAYVAQQAWIFSGTIKENILFGKPYEDTRFEEVVKCCGLELDIQMLEHGDETEIGERGITLSGGQKQRVNLARAAYSNSDIYLLDDPMSALDTTVGKRVFQDCIKGFLKDKTVILVTHQLQYFCDCDNVVVLTGGMIVGHDTHSELLQQCGLYNNMHKELDQTTEKANQHCQTQDQLQAAKIVVPNGAGPRPVYKVIQEGKHLTRHTTFAEHKVKLVTKEESARGTISFATYNAYVQACGGWPICLSVLGVYLLSCGSLIFNDWWLTEWIESGHFKVADRGNASNVSGNRTGTIATFTDQHDSILSAMDYDNIYLIYVLSLVGLIILFVMQACSHVKVALVGSSKLHLDCLDNIIKAPLSFFEANPAGRILNRFTKDLDEGDIMLPFIMNAAIRFLFTIGLSILLIAIISPWALFATVPITVAIYVIMRAFSVAVRTLKRIENVSRSPLISHVNVTTQGLSTIVAYGQREAFYDSCVEFGDKSSMAFFLFMASVRWVCLRADLAIALYTVVLTLIFILSKGDLSPVYVGLALSACIKIKVLMQPLVNVTNDIEGRFTSIERLCEYGQTLPAEEQQGSVPSLSEWPKRGAVEFRDVSMRYRAGLELVLQSVSFVIKPREKTGVVGRTGSGKSSLVVSLLRLVEPCGGKILVDGEDVSKLSLTCLRSRISTIPQDPVLFRGTIRYNIDPFSSYCDDEIWDALEKVQIKKKIVQLSDALQSHVEEGGNNFSVGERQLLCLARAVLRRSKILALDEATANIDTSTDTMLQDTIRTCFVDCTVITIAHRLSTVLHCDNIIVMDAGQVIEWGRPNDLLADPNSHLNRMLSAQDVSR